MAPLPPNGTERLFLDYSVAGYEHTVCNRFDIAESDASDAAGALQAFVEAITPVVYLSTFVRLRLQLRGTDITLPFSYAFPATWGSGSAAGNESAQYWDFIGRGPTGRRVRVSHFGATSVSSGDLYRVAASGVAGLAAALAVLTASDGCFLDIDNQEPTWYPYVNMGVNAYWRNKIR